MPEIPDVTLDADTTTPETEPAAAAMTEAGNGSPGADAVEAGTPEADAVNASAIVVDVVEAAARAYAAGRADAEAAHAAKAAGTADATEQQLEAELGPKSK
jgi:hypothetical protein